MDNIQDELICFVTGVCCFFLFWIVNEAYTRPNFVLPIAAIVYAAMYGFLSAGFTILAAAEWSRQY